MDTSGWVLELSCNYWRLLQIGGGTCVMHKEVGFAPADLLEQAQIIEAMLSEIANEGQKNKASQRKLLLAPASDWTMVMPMAAGNRQQHRQRNSMLYRLEELIPLAAEDIVADWVVNQNSVLAVAMAREPLGSFISELELSGIQVVSVSPLAMLATQTSCQSEGAKKDCLLVAEYEGQLELIEIEGGQPVNWLSLAGNPESLIREVNRLQIMSMRQLAVRHYGLTDEILSALTTEGFEVTDIAAEPGGSSYLEAVSQTATSVLAAQSEPLIELGQDSIVGDVRKTAVAPYWAALQIAAALLVVAVCLGFVLRGNHHALRAGELQASQRQAFQGVFPNTKVPTGIRRRLQSELSRLEGLRGDSGEVPSAIPALGVLKSLMEAMPMKERFRLHEVRIENGHLFVSGEVRQHSDAEMITKLLKQHNFGVSAPSTHRLEGKRVSFRISGNYQESIPERIAKRTTAK